MRLGLDRACAFNLVNGICLFFEKLGKKQEGGKPDVAIRKGGTGEVRPKES